MLSDAPAKRDARADGHRLGGFIYGTIVAMAVVVDGAHATPGDVTAVAVLVAVTSLTFWLAHVYAHELGESLAREERPGLRDAWRLGRGELSIVEAAVLPVVALALGATGLVSAHASYWIAIAVGIGVLAAQGLRFARIEHLGPVGTTLVLGANVAFGLVMVALKLVAMH